MDGTCRDGALALFVVRGISCYAISFTKMKHQS
jgi:hypothetical protein